MLSRVTGQSRKQLSEELKRQGQDLRLKSLMATMDKDAQANLQAIVAGLGNVDPKLKSAIEEMVVTGGAPVSEFGRMLASTSPELVNLAAGVRNGSVSSAEFAAGVRRAAAGANANRESLQGLATAAAITGNDMYLAQASLLSLTEYQSKASEATQEQMKAQQDAMFTHYMYNTLWLNPAYAGTRDAFTVTGIHRSQWVGFDGAPVNQSITMHTPIMNGKVGVGLSVLNDKIGPTKSTSIALDLDYQIRLNTKSKLSFGICLYVPISNLILVHNWYHLYLILYNHH
jgi:hypothetical protein